MFAVLACLFYSVYGIGFVACVAFTIVFAVPRLSTAFMFMMHKEMKNYTEQEIRSKICVSAACLTLVGKLLFIICWHYA